MAEPEAKKPRRAQRFRKEYALKWPFLLPSKVDEYHTFCSICNCDFSISHGGVTDCEKHVQTSKHLASVSIKRKHGGGIANFFARPSAEEDHSVINAEVLFTDFIVEHNIPIAVTDHVGPLIRKMFPDSKIAKAYGCARTKTTAIIGASAAENTNEISTYMKNAPFSLATDGSNDYGDHKLYPVLVRYFDEKQGQVLSCLLSIEECSESSTGKHIFELMDRTLSKFGVPWENCISFGADNASVMTGQKSGVKAFLLKVSMRFHS